VYRVDLGSSQDLPVHPGKLDAVLWLAQGAGYRDFPKSTVPMVGVNLLGLAQTLELARHAGARQFLYASTGNVYKPSLLPLREDAPEEATGLYPLTKLAGEKLVQLYRGYLAITCLRIFGIYGPGQQNALTPNLISRIRSREAVTLEPAGAARDGGLEWTPCYIADATTLLCRLLEAERCPEVLNVAGPEKVSIEQVARAIAEALHTEVEIRLGSRPRTMNLVADSTLLRGLFPEYRFVPFRTGIEQTLAAVNNVRAA